MSTPEQLLIGKVKEDFLRAKARRTNLSLRAYAKRIGVDAPVLSEILSGKRKITHRLAKILTSGINLSREEAEEITSTFPSKQTRQKIPLPLRQQLALSEFDMIADYWYFGIIHLAETTECLSDPDWIAARLKIPVTKATKAIRVLMENGYVEESKGYLRSLNKDFITTDDIPSEAIKSNHAQGLELARDALFEDSVEMREFRSLTLSVNKNNMPEFKKFIRKFTKEFNAKFGKKSSDEVYRLQVQFYSLTKKLDSL